MPTAPLEPPRLPSADLVQYRFDKIDESQALVLKGFDDLKTEMRSTFVPREEINLMIRERDEKEISAHRELHTKIEIVDKKVTEEHDNKRWLNRALITASVSALFIALGSLVVGVLLRK